MMTLHLSGLTLPVTVRLPVPMSDSELEAFSEVNRPYRIEQNKDGELIIMTPLGGMGGVHEGEVYMQLGAWTKRDGRGIAFSPNTGFRLPDGSCLAPDGAWIPLERWNAMSREEKKTYPHFCPDFLIEVRSVSDSRPQLEKKMQQWIEYGAQLAWLVDPIDASVTVYRPGEATETLERPDVVMGHAPVDGFELQTTQLWSEE